MNEQQAQQQFIADLAEVYGVQSEEELAAVVKKIQPAIPTLFAYWKKGGKQALAQGLQQLSKVQSRRIGGQIEYLNRLNGKCPAGYEVEYHKAGGCVKCKKVEMEKCGGKKRITKKQEGDSIDAMKCGGKKVKKGEEGLQTPQKPKRVVKPAKQAPKPAQEVGERSKKPMPTQYDKTKHKDLINRFQKNPGFGTPDVKYYKGFSPASMDSLQWYNRHEPNAPGV